MKIVAGQSTLMAQGLYGDFVNYNGTMVDGIKIVLNESLTQVQINDLITQPWNIYDDNNVLQSTQQGYNKLYQHSALFMRVPDVLKENEALRAALAATEAELQAVKAQIPTTK